MTNNFDDFLANLLAVKEELGDKPANLVFASDSGEIEIRTSIQSGKPVRNVYIGTN